MITFAEQPTIETYNIQLASDDAIKEHLAKPRNWVPQRHETLPEIPPDTAFICSPADVPGPCKVQLQDKDISVGKHSPRIMRTSAQQNSYKWTLTQETAHQ